MLVRFIDMNVSANRSIKKEKENDLTHTELFNRLNKSLKGKFSGNISWYGETVELDLEAKK